MPAAAMPAAGFGSLLHQLGTGAGAPHADENTIFIY